MYIHIKVGTVYQINPSHFCKTTKIKKMCQKRILNLRYCPQMHKDITQKQLITNKQNISFG